MNQIIPALQILIAFQCLFFLGFLVLAGRLNVTANRLLFILLAVFAVHMTANLVNQHLYTNIWPNFSIGLGYAYGPTIYLYTMALIFKGFTLKPKHILHALPCFLIIVLTTRVHLEATIYALGIFASLLSYIYQSRKELRKYRHVLSQTRSGFNEIALHWLSRLLVIQLVLLVINIASVTLYSGGFEQIGFLMEIALFISLLFLVSFVVFNGLQHPELFEGITQEDQDLTNQSSSEKPQIMSEAEVSSLLQKIDQHMSEKQTFLNPSLTVKALGRQLATNPKYISQAINIGKKQNFSEYVNSFRISYAQSLLTREGDEDLSVLDILLQSGFNTKSNFNRSFKDQTGLTPLEFKRKNVGK